jgi:hypothetical protein
MKKLLYGLGMLSTLLVGEHLRASNLTTPADEINELKQNIPIHMHLNVSPSKYMGCHLFLQEEEVDKESGCARVVNISAGQGYVLDSKHLPRRSNVLSVNSSYHDATYSDDLRRGDLTELKDPKTQLRLVPVQGDDEMLAFLKFCHNLQRRAKPLPHFGLIDYKNFLAWRVEPKDKSEESTYLTVICKQSSVKFAEVKMYTDASLVLPKFMTDVRAAIDVLLLHLMHPSRAVKLGGYQFEIAEEDQLMQDVIAELNLAKSQLPVVVGIVSGVENGRWVMVPIEVMGYRYYKLCQ